VYDTETAGLSIAPRLPIGLRGAWTLAAATGSSLYVLGSCTESAWWTGRFTVPTIDGAVDAPTPGYHETYWSWTSIPSQLPFNISSIASSALHPEVGGGRTLFVSASKCERNPELGGRTLFPSPMNPAGRKWEPLKLVGNIFYLHTPHLLLRRRQPRVEAPWRVGAAVLWRSPLQRCA
jgi:hypothetical protein